jgi:2-dehydro-3-deoxyphosphogluconate aldolase/(4S)-4-hydroxy-2-oxoglutarate aldolase
MTYIPEPFTNYQEEIIMANKFALEHIGINCAAPAEAAALAEQLSAMFNLNPRHGNKSEFGGDYFECMKTPFLGTNGHIAMRTDNLDAAVAELKEKGYGFRMETAAYNEDGSLKNIYLEGEYGGFAIHILNKPV